MGGYRPQGGNDDSQEESHFAGDFTLPKTDAGTDRVIHLIQPAIDTLKNRAEMTRLGRQYQIEVKLREYGRSTMHPCTFIFNPQVTRKNSYAGHHYSVRSVSSIWETVTKRAGIRYRKAYQSRHTYACWSLSAGANPTFIASQMGHSSAQMVYSVYGASDGRKQRRAGFLAESEAFGLCPIHAPEGAWRYVEVSDIEVCRLKTEHINTMSDMVAKIEQIRKPILNITGCWGWISNSPGVATV